VLSLWLLVAVVVVVVMLQLLQVVDGSRVGWDLVMLVVALLGGCCVVRMETAKLGLLLKDRSTRA
jgi:hypothetical protein